MVLHEIAHRVVDGYVDVTDAVQRDIDEIESVVFAPRSPLGAEQMYLMKREIIELRRAVVPLARPLRRHAGKETEMIRPRARSYFRKVEDQLAVVADRVTGFDEVLNTLVNATPAKVTLQQNTDMRRITVWAAIVAMPTMIVGVYGMNFNYMPELHWQLGYPAVIAVILLVCLTLHRVFKRNHWL